MNSVPELTAVQHDALLEVTSIGSGHAATVLSKMSDTAIMISTAELVVTRLSDVADRLRESEEPLVATAAQIRGDLAGHIVFVIPQSRAAQLCDILLHAPPGSTSIHNELEQSTLKELGNILGSSFMNALAELMGVVLIPSVPTLTIDPPAALAGGLGLGGESELALYIRTRFHFHQPHTGGGARREGDELAGILLFLPTGKSLKDIFTAIKVS